MTKLPDFVSGPRHVGLRAGLPFDVTSFAPVRGGRVSARSVYVLEVRNEELGPDVDVDAYAAARLAALDPDAVAMLTGRDVSTARRVDLVVDGIAARVLCTVGLSNAVALGAPPGPLAGPATIDVVAAVDVPLAESAALELLTLVAAARTAAVLEAAIVCRRTGGRATGTGTDCIAVMSPPGDAGHRYAGTHTAVGAAVGAAALGAIGQAVRAWKEQFGS